MEFEKIRDIIAEQMGVAKDSITEETKFQQDLNADSLDIFQIVSELEDIFDMEFDSDDASNIVTVGDAVKHIEKALGA